LRALELLIQTEAATAAARSTKEEEKEQQCGACEQLNGAYGAVERVTISVKAL
jgi:hypothetical protein